MQVLLDQPLLQLSPKDALTYRQALEGVQIFGDIGSGKTSGSGEALIRAYLKAGFGGLALTSMKPGEAARWKRLAAECGRSESLLIMDGSGQERFNFLQYEMHRPGGGYTANLVDLLVTLSRAVSRESHRSGTNAVFWQNALEELLRNTIDAARLAGEPMTLPLLSRIIRTAPTSQEMLESESWRAASTCWKILQQAAARDLSEAERSDFDETWFYWTHSFPVVTPYKQRGSAISMFTGITDELLRYPFRELFCSDTTWVPEQTHDGLIVLVDFPISVYRRVGRVVQLLIKLIWQQALLRRDPVAKPTPSFLYCDEAHALLTGFDATFAALAREHRGAIVYLTQNLPGYEHALAGADRGALHQLLACLNTKIFHAQNDEQTCRWASILAGKRPTLKSSLSRMYNERPGGDGSPSAAEPAEMETLNLTTQWTEHMRPEELQYRLRKGGAAHHYLVDAYIVQSGRLWTATGSPVLKTTFRQHATP